jgi:hypothetical protein
LSANPWLELLPLHPNPSPRLRLRVPQANPGPHIPLLGPEKRMHIFVLNGKVDNFQVPASKSGFYSERADEFVISPNKQTKLFS